MQPYVLRKAIPLSLILALSLTLTACGGGSEPQPPASSEQAVPAESSPAETPAAEPGEQTDAESSVEMLVQSYEHDNIIEIPEIRSASPAAEAINQEILAFAEGYQDYIDGHPDGFTCEIKAYPFADSRYIQIIMNRAYYPTYGTDGDVIGFVYDVEADAVVTLEEAMAQDGKTQEDLHQQFEEWGERYMLFEQRSLVSCEARAFLFTDAGVRYMLEVTEATADGDEVKSTYVWRPETESFYHLSNFLFEADEPMQLSPPLACAQWQPDDPTGEWNSIDYDTNETDATLLVNADGTCELRIVDGDRVIAGTWECYGDCLDILLEGQSPVQCTPDMPLIPAEDGTNYLFARG